MLFLYYSAVNKSICKDTTYFWISKINLSHSVFPLPVLAQVFNGCIVVECFDGEYPKDDNEENDDNANDNGLPWLHTS